VKQHAGPYVDSPLAPVALAFVAALRAHHEESGEHTPRVARISLRIARAMNLSPSRTQDLYFGALLHDVGKLVVPQSILNKRCGERLTESEWETLRAHTWRGTTLLQGRGFNEAILCVVEEHHQFFDGTGYPYALAGDAISLEARICSVADAYDAITADRCYRAGSPDAIARHEIAAGAGTQFDPAVVEAFLKISADELSALTAK
jgi:putative nucleotidyltransferase with HDIG domain